MNDDNEELRGHAAECQRMADSVQDPADKRQWMRLAEKWLRMITPTAKHVVDARGETADANPSATDIAGASAADRANGTQTASDNFDGEVARQGTRQTRSDSSH